MNQLKNSNFTFLILKKINEINRHSVKSLSFQFSDRDSNSSNEILNPSLSYKCLARFKQEKLRTYVCVSKDIDEFSPQSHRKKFRKQW